MTGPKEIRVERHLHRRLDPSSRADKSLEDVQTNQSAGKPDFDGQFKCAQERPKLTKAPLAIAAQFGSLSTSSPRRPSLHGVRG